MIEKVIIGKGRHLSDLMIDTHVHLTCISHEERIEI